MAIDWLESEAKTLRELDELRDKQKQVITDHFDALNALLAGGGTRYREAAGEKVAGMLIELIENFASSLSQASEETRTKARKAGYKLLLSIDH